MIWHAPRQNKLQNKIQLLNANPRRLSSFLRTPRPHPPQPIAKCVKQTQPRSISHLFTIFYIVYCIYKHTYLVYRAKCGARQHFIYVFVFISWELHKIIIEKSLRGSLCGDITTEKKKRNEKLGNLCGGNLFLASGTRKSQRPKVAKLAPVETDNKMHKSLLKIHYYSELFNYPWLPLHTIFSRWQ